MLNARVHLLAALMICPFLAACGNSNRESEKKVEIKPAPKLTNDATTYANAAWKLINEIDVLVYNKQVTDIEEKVRKPIRQLSTDWRINVKMTDSVTEGKYALCRKALTSLDSWARDVKDNARAQSKALGECKRITKRFKRAWF